MACTISAQRFRSDTHTDHFNIEHPAGCTLKQAKSFLKEQDTKHTISNEMLSIVRHLGEENDPLKGVKRSVLAVNDQYENDLYQGVLKQMAAFLEAQKKIRPNDGKEGSLIRRLSVVRQTRITPEMLAKVVRCVTYLREKDKPAQTGQATKIYRYKLSDFSFSILWHKKAFKGVILHFKKKNGDFDDYKVAGGIAKTSKAIEFKKREWRVLAERCEHTFDARAVDPHKKYASSHVIEHPYYFNLEYYGRRALSSLEAESDADSTQSLDKMITQKNVTFLPFLELELFDLVTAYKQWLTPESMWDIMIRICEGVRDIHKEDDAHRDLKLDNIMVSFKKDDKTKKMVLSDLRIIDLEFVRSKQEADRLIEEARAGKMSYPDTWCGDENFWSPEENTKTVQWQEADIYALGRILGQIYDATKSKPNDKDTKWLIKLFAECKDKDPKNRPCAQDILKRLRKHNPYK